MAGTERERSIRGRVFDIHVVLAVTASEKFDQNNQTKNIIVSKFESIFLLSECEFQSSTIVFSFKLIKCFKKSSKTYDINDVNYFVRQSHLGVRFALSGGWRGAVPHLGHLLSK